MPYLVLRVLRKKRIRALFVGFGVGARGGPVVSGGSATGTTDKHELKGTRLAARTAT